MCYVHTYSLSHVCLFTTPWTVAYQVPRSMRILQERILEWVAMLSPGDLSNPGIEPRSPTLNADTLPAEPPGKPKKTGMGSLVLFQGVFQTQELNLLLLYCRQILYQLNYQIDWQCCDSFGWIVNRDSEYMNMYGWVPIFFWSLLLESKGNSH